MTEFDTWLLRRAREKPTNPIYAHLQARAAMELGPVENVEAEPVSVRLNAGVEAPANKVIVDDVALDDPGEETPNTEWDGIDQ